MIGNSIAQSAQPLLSYNYGIARWSHVVRVRRLSLLTSLIFGLVVTLLFMGVPKAMVALFVDAESTAGVLATEGFPLYGLGIIFFILNVAIIGYFQSIERLRSALSIVETLLGDAPKNGGKAIDDQQDDEEVAGLPEGHEGCGGQEDTTDRHEAAQDPKQNFHKMNSSLFSLLGGYLTPWEELPR